LADRLGATEKLASFADIGGVGAATVEGHRGEVWRCGSCMVALGRRHVYEGNDDPMMALVSWLAGQGISDLVTISAAGALRGEIPPESVTVVRDTIDLQFHQALGRRREAASVAATDPEPRLVIDQTLAARIETAAEAARVPYSRATLVSVPGPAFETVAEVQMVAEMGGDVVSMSALPELRAAQATGLRAGVVAVVTNPATGVGAHWAGHAGVLEAAGRSVDRLVRIITQLVDIY